MEKSKYFPRQPNEERFERFDQAVAEVHKIAEQQRPRLVKGADFEAIRKSVLTKKNSEGH